MKLVACPKCHAQYDLAGVRDRVVTCPCGTTFPAKPPDAVDAAVTRCAACGAIVGPSESACGYCGAEIARRPAPAGPVCPVCYARNPETARYCTACGVAFLPQPVRTGLRSLECPACAGSRLAARSLGGVWVDECPECLGLWAPGDVMDRLVDRIRERRRQEGAPAGGRPRGERRSVWQAAVAYRRCPECGAGMQRKNFGHRSGVIVDWCGNHGTWLDAHEMEDIAEFVLDGGLESAPGTGQDRNWSLPADPKRMEAIAAAERILAEERARGLEKRHRQEIGSWGDLKGIGDLFARLLR